MTAALRRHLAPALEASGFTGRFPRYRRLRGDAGIDFLLVAYDKPGETLFFEFGTHPRGELQTSWGEVVPEDKLLLEHVGFTKRARLQARCGGGSTTDQWFAFGHLGNDAAAYDTLAMQLCDLLPQVTGWLERREVGSHVSPNSAATSSKTDTAEQRR